MSLRKVSHDPTDIAPCIVLNVYSLVHDTLLIYDYD